MEFGNRDGRGINATVPSAICSLIWQACHPDDIHREVVDAVMLAGKRAGLEWDRQEEIKKTHERIASAYHNVFEPEYDPAGGVPLWLPMEFHEAWAAALAADKRPTMSRNGAGWHIRSYYQNGEKTNGGAEGNNETGHSESQGPNQNDGSKAPFV